MMEFESSLRQLSIDIYHNRCYASLHFGGIARDGIHHFDFVETKAGILFLLESVELNKVKFQTHTN